VDNPLAARHHERAEQQRGARARQPAHAQAIFLPHPVSRSRRIDAVMTAACTAQPAPDRSEFGRFRGESTSPGRYALPRLGDLGEL